MSTFRSKTKQTATLNQLASAGILFSKPMGKRHIICARSSEVIYHGFDLPEYLNDDLRPTPRQNFHPGSFMVDASVLYQDRRARMSATSGYPDWQGTPCDVSSHFPLNELATTLINADTTQWYGCYPGQRLIYGDAFLITDTRKHWWMYPGEMASDDILFAHENLVTPRNIYFDYNDNPYILFLERPQIDDLFYLKMTYYKPQGS